jgi:hypothetical protein
MAGDNYEPNRVLGFPRTRDAHARQARQAGQAGQAGQARQNREPQRVMGLPVDSFADWFGSVDGEWVQSLAHPVRTYRRWLRRRRLGPYATDEDKPSPRR